MDRDCLRGDSRDPDDRGWNQGCEGSSEARQPSPSFVECRPFQGHVVGITARSWYSTKERAVFPL